MALSRTIIKSGIPHDRPEDLSVATELKFLVPLLPRDGINLNSSIGPQAEFASFVHSAKHVELEDKSRLWKHVFSNIANAIKTIPGQQALTSFELENINTRERDCWSTHWIVKKSNSAEPSKNHPHRDDWLWVPVEVNSPKMCWKDPKTFGIVAAVMNVIKTRHYVVSNYSCEVHVHVGRIDGCPFSLPTLKRIAMLTWLVEPVLRRVKDPSSPNFQHVYTWSSAVREHSRLAMDLSIGKLAHGPEPGDLEGLRRGLKRHLMDPNEKLTRNLAAMRFIAATRSRVQLGRLMSGEGRPYRRLGYNFSAFGGEDERARTNPKTVECRFLEGIMDTDVVLGWIRIFGSMIQAALDGAMEDDEENFSKLALHGARNSKDEDTSDLAFVKLMRKLQVSDKVYRPVQELMQTIHSQAKRR